jgi:drug/metabolite transporter (DMT)-like permease
MLVLFEVIVMSDHNKGVLFLLIAALGFAFMSVFVKQAGDLPVAQKVLARNLVSLIVSGIMITRYKGSYFGKPEHRGLLLLRSTLGTAGMVLFFFSIDRLVAADANMLNKLSSFFLILFSYLFLKEKVSVLQVGAIVVAFLGSLLIIKPAFDLSLLPYATSILAAMFAGAAYTVLRALGPKEAFYTVVFVFSLFSVVVLTPIVAIGWTPMAPHQWGYLLLTGIGATIGQFGTTIAYKYAPARDISIFNYANVVFVTLIAIPLLGEWPDRWSLIGYVVIFVAAYVVFQSKKHRKST